MRASTKQSAEPIRLDFKSVQPVVVIPENEDRFVTTCREAAYACKAFEGAREAFESALQWEKQFQRFLAFVHTWCEKHAADVERCFVGVSDEGLRVFVVTKSEEYEFRFDDAISQANMEVFAAFPRIPVSIVQIPHSKDDCLSAFFSLADSIQVYGK